MSDPFPPAAHPVKPKIIAAKLWEKKRDDGGSYYSGNWGGVKVLVTPNREQDGVGDAGWVLIFQEEVPANRRKRITGKE